MMICDSREKKNGHIIKYLEKNNIPYMVRKMDVADFQVAGRDNLVIDRKQNLDELSANLTSPMDKGRFMREVRRSSARGIKMIVLCEHGGDIHNIADISKWNSRYSGVSGRDLMELVYKCHISYGVEFMFCKKSETPKKIVELLGVK